MTDAAERLLIRTDTLEIAYEESGPADGPPVILLHGFPDDPHAYDGVAPPLAAAGCRVLVPYLRGYGPTRFLDAGDAALGRSRRRSAHDLLDFMDALGIERAVLAGYDWGGRAACIVAALWPERVRGLVTIGGYNIQDIAASATPAPPSRSIGYWYQWYFHTERGRAGLAREPPRPLPAAVAALVAELDVRRRDLRAHRGDLRQSRFRRGGDPLLSPPLRRRAGRSGARADRAAPRRPAADHRADDRAARRMRRGRPSGQQRGPRRRFTRPAPARGYPAGRPLPAAGGARGGDRGAAGTGGGGHELIESPEKRIEFLFGGGKRDFVEARGGKPRFE